MKGETFTDFAAVNAGLSLEDFVAKFPEPFLLSEGGLPATSSGDPEITRHSDSNVAEVEMTEPVVFRIRRGDKPKGMIVTLGRTPDCDLTIDSILVSKRHAYFAQDPDDSWVIADVESRNGTFVEGKRLVPHERHRLNDGEAIRFGPSLRFRFFLTEAFHRYTAFRSRMKKAD